MSMIGILVRRGNRGFGRINHFPYKNLATKQRHVVVLDFRRFFAANDRSKVEETLKMLKEDLERQQKEAEKRKQSVALAKKEPLKARIVHELKHYYHGFRLLVLETRLSAKYMFRLARGDALTRRERQQMVRTVSDLFRLVPFSFFIIVPFMELALPFFIKLFPNMLPSTFQEKSKQKEKIRKQLRIKVEMAKFLQDTLEEIALERKKGLKAEEQPSKAYEFSQFLRKVRTEGQIVSNEELFKFLKLFEDELTLDNLSLGQLRALCKMIGVQPLGTPEILRFQLNLKLRELKADDRLIMAEGGVDALSVPDLQQACRQRGMRAIGVSEARLRAQLAQWLELSQNDKMPPSMLLLSRALFLPEDVTFSQRLRAIVQQLPEELGEQTKQKLTELEGGKVDPKERMALLRSIELGLKAEREQEALRVAAESKQRAEAEQKQLEQQQQAELALAQKAEQEAAARELLQVEPPAPDLAPPLEVVVNAAAADVPQASAEAAKKPAKIQPAELRAVEKVLHGSHLDEARHDISELKEKVIEHTEDLIEVNSLADDYAESKVARRLRARVNSMIAGVDTLVARLESERRQLDPAAPSLIPDAASVEPQKSERLVKIRDLLDQLTAIQATGDDSKAKRIEEVLTAMDEDTDGCIDSKLALQVLELLGKHKNVEINPEQMQQIIELLKKEDVVEGLQKERDARAASTLLDATIPELLELDAPIQVRAHRVHKSPKDKQPAAQEAPPAEERVAVAENDADQPELPIPPPPAAPADHVQRPAPPK